MFFQRILWLSKVHPVNNVESFYAEDVSRDKNTRGVYKNRRLTWSFGSPSQDPPQAKDDGTLVLLHDLRREGKAHQRLLCGSCSLTRLRFLQLELGSGKYLWTLITDNTLLIDDTHIRDLKCCSSNGLLKYRNKMLNLKYGNDTGFKIWVKLKLLLAIFNLLG